MVKKRCDFETCQKKLELSAFPCKCCKIFCPTHRAHMAHGCTFDYRADQTSTLMKHMGAPVIAMKLATI